MSYLRLFLETLKSLADAFLQYVKLKEKTPEDRKSEQLSLLDKEMEETQVSGRPVRKDLRGR